MTPPTSARPSVLIVDDDASTQHALRTAFLALNAETFAAPDAASATRALERASWSAAVIDLSLPDGNGIDVVRFVRDAGATMPIVILSQAGDFEAKIAALRAGADAYYEKPADWRSVANNVLNLLQGIAGARILIVEDDAIAASAGRRILESAGYRTTVCDNPRLFETALLAFRPDAVLMDMRLPFADGAELATFLRQDERFEMIPVVYVTALGEDDEPVRSAIQRGEAVLRKPVPPDLLLAAVASRLDQFRRLRALLERDSLTGVLTRGAFLTRAASTAAMTERNRNHQFSLAMIDVDHFKQVNDRYGHAVGDGVLVALADTLRRGLRQTDYIGRYGGEEFVVMIAEAGERAAAALIERILANFRLVEHQAGPSATVSVTFSAGVAGLGDDRAIEQAIVRADEALYEAKSSGRNRVVAASRVRPQDDAVIDADILAGLRELGTMSGHDVVGELAEMFAELAPGRAAAMAGAIDGRNGDGLAREAHALRGAAGNVGLFQVMRVCEELELIGITTRWDAADSAIRRLDRLLAIGCDALRDAARSGGN